MELALLQPRKLAPRQEGPPKQAGCGALCLAPSTLPPGMEFSWGKASARKRTSHSPQAQDSDPKSMLGKAQHYPSWNSLSPFSTLIFLNDPS